MRALLAAAVLLLASCGSAPHPTVRIERDESCPKALDAADAVIAKAHDGFGLVGDVIDAILANDGDAALAANDKLTTLADSVSGDVKTYNQLADECRSGS